MAVQLLGGLSDGVPRIPQRFARALQIFRIRLFNELHHLIEVVVLEVRPALHGRTQRCRFDSRLQQATEEPERRPFFETTRQVRSGVLLRDSVVVRLVMLVGHR
ncbi:MULTISPECIES: hypothetical protein [Streptomyces]|uniref:hypothetical protein n=1 Tax=Streptomyces TaxID=1883 RepID=UPI003676C8B2